MKASVAILRADEIRPGNQIGADIKRKWLYNLDARIFLNVISAHEGAGEAPNDYTDEDDSELLLSAPDDELYLWYLASQIDAATGETERFNISIAKYNELYSDFTKRYTRTHTPLQNARLKNVYSLGGIR